MAASPALAITRKKSFEGQQRETPWDDIDVVYFVGEACGHTLIRRSSTPMKASSRKEVPSIQVENRKPWRRLKVTLPDTVKSHTKERDLPALDPMDCLRHGT